jgi:hypothetical protein
MLAAQRPLRRAGQEIEHCMEGTGGRVSEIGALCFRGAQLVMGPESGRFNQDISVDRHQFQMRYVSAPCQTSGCRPVVVSRSSLALGR